MYKLRRRFFDTRRRSSIPALLLCSIEQRDPPPMATSRARSGYIRTGLPASAIRGGRSAGRSVGVDERRRRTRTRQMRRQTWEEINQLRSTAATAWLRVETDWWPRAGWGRGGKGGRESFPRPRPPPCRLPFICRNSSANIFTVADRHDDDVDDKCADRVVLGAAISLPDGYSTAAPHPPSSATPPSASAQIWTAVESDGAI